MSAPKRANDINSLPCWKVRIYVRGCGLLHALSSSEPVVVRDSDGALVDCQMDIMPGTEHGDTLGFVNWLDVAAVSWRFAPLATAMEAR